MPEHDSANCRIRQQAGFDWQFEKKHFEAAFWTRSEVREQTLGGRGGSSLIEIDGRRAVLRRYRRGGAMGNLFSDQYLWLGQSMTRPWREWDILLRGRDAGLPVPEPIAACTCRGGLFYRAALITAFLDDTEMMTRRLQREPLPRECWHDLGGLIKRMHGVGIQHVDLTPDNILMDSANRFYIVDFDKARSMKRLGDWQWQPIKRFQRGIVKRKGLQALHYDDHDWQVFMEGYRA